VPACAAKLDDYAALSAGLSALPCPLPLPDLLRRTNTLVAAEVDRRQGAAFAGAAAIFALVFVLLIGQTLRIVAGDSAALAWLGLGLGFLCVGRGFSPRAGLAPPSRKEYRMTPVVPRQRVIPFGGWLAAGIVFLLGFHAVQRG
jgi:hypothetical protein